MKTSYLVKNYSFTVISAVFVFAAAFGFCGCSGTGTEPADDTSEKTQTVQETKGKKTIIVYYSYSGNTRAVAKQIAGKIGNSSKVDMFEIETEKEYPSEYGVLVKQAQKEIKAGYLPELKKLPENFSDYDIVFIGSPNWWGTITPAVSSFIHKEDFSGKTVIPFFTHGSGGMQNMAKDTAAQLEGSGAAVLKAAAFRGDPKGAPEKALDAWLEETGFSIK